MKLLDEAPAALSSSGELRRKELVAETKSYYRRAESHILAGF